MVISVNLYLTRGHYISVTNIFNICNVAPLVGAWIEIKKYKNKIDVNYVAPLVGAWIEIYCQIIHQNFNMSLLL